MSIEVDHALRQQMLMFALLQLANKDLAEDVVQEALLSAVKNANGFAGRSAWKTWVFAILKNKIADALRQKTRNLEDTNLIGGENDHGLPDVFERCGHWKHGEEPESWGAPEAAFEQARFWEVFETCLQALPDAQAQVFMMRELVGLQSEDICRELGLSTSNLHVLLYRARLRLRESLENDWFSSEELCT